MTIDAHPLEDLRTFGLLWALNRYVLHPRGLALGLGYDTDNVEEIEAHRYEPCWFNIYVEPEPWTFEEEADREGFEAFNAFLKEHTDAG